MRGKFEQKTENKYQKLEIHISKPEKKTYHVSAIPFRGDYTMAEATNPLFSSNFFFFYGLFSSNFKLYNTQKAQCNEQKPPKLKIYREIIESRKGIRTYKFQGKFQNV